MPYKDAEKEKRKKREWIRRKRLNEKLEREQKDPLDLNAGMKPLEDDFPSKEYFEELLGHEMTDTEYIKHKIKAQKERKELKERTEREQLAEQQGILALEPFNPKTRNKCIRFRRAYLSLTMANEDFEIQNHNAKCDCCGRWLASYSKKVAIEGVSLW